MKLLDKPLPWVWFQPVRYVAEWAKLGVKVFCGPEVENPKALSPADLARRHQEWLDAVGEVGGWVVLKNPPASLPERCVGVLLSVDEPNGKGVPASALKAESDRLRAAYPGTPLILSLAGDKVSSANFTRAWELQAYKDYAGVCDCFTVNFYSANRNANRYPTTLTGDVVKKLRDATGKPVVAWVECNDQRLPAPPPPDANRAPSAAEIKATADHALASGAAGVGWFATCDSGKYGWPQSYYPQADRNGVSMGPQYGMVQAVNYRLSPPPLEDALTAITEQVQQLKARVQALEDWARAAPRD